MSSSLGRVVKYDAKTFIEQLELNTSNNLLNLSNLTFSNIDVLQIQINSNIDSIDSINETIGTERIQQVLDIFDNEVQPFVQSTGLINRIDEILYDVVTLQIAVGDYNLNPKT